MITINAWLSYKLTANRNETQENYYQYLDEEIIDAVYDKISRRSRRSEGCAYVRGSLIISEYGKPKNYMGIHFTSMKDRMDLKKC